MQDLYDAIIVGTGIAGLTAAIVLHEAGKRILLITKEEQAGSTNTRQAQGGIVAWKNGDNPEILEQDIIHAGCRWNNKSAVEELSSHGPVMVQKFLDGKIGTRFDKDSAGEYDYTEEAAHSTRRILHFGDRTGEEIQRSLLEYTRKINLDIRTNTTAIDIITNNHHSLDRQAIYAGREVLGVYALDNLSGKVQCLLAHNTILSTGGLGNLYQHTTNLPLATGDGIAMAYRAGADIINAEFVQFHPTCLFHRDLKGFLISESLRGEGARLLDSRGRPFMSEYSPDGNMAPRDVTARAIYDKMSKDGTEYVLLDIATTYKGKKPLEQRFSKIYSTCMELGIDISRDPIPVVPAAHYFCGGIRVNTKGHTSLKNLYAVGEVSCTGLHGANRLASTSLLEGLLWGKNCAEDILQKKPGIPLKLFQSIPEWHNPSANAEFDSLLLKQDWQGIKMTMWNYAGIIRTSRGLKRAKADLGYFSHRIFDFYQNAMLTREIIELRNAVITARIIVNSALHNTESIGCHYREEGG